MLLSISIFRRCHQVAGIRPDPDKPSKGAAHNIAKLQRFSGMVTYLDNLLGGGFIEEKDFEKDVIKLFHPN